MGSDGKLRRAGAGVAEIRARSAAFKTPGLRNVEFTGPYFHNGGQATLSDVVDFNSRGSDFPDGGNLGPDIGRRNLTQEDRQALIAFLKALSDDRVRFERAPFDHPELCVAAGHYEPTPQTLQTFDELLAGTGSDGSRAHTLADACTIP